MSIFSYKIQIYITYSSVTSQNNINYKISLYRNWSRAVTDIKFKLHARILFVKNFALRCESTRRFTNQRSSCMSVSIRTTTALNHAHRCWPEREELVIHSAKQQYERLYCFLRKRATWRNPIVVKSRVEKCHRVARRSRISVNDTVSWLVSFRSRGDDFWLVSQGSRKGYRRSSVHLPRGIAFGE